jgi:hypothetical protein
MITKVGSASTETKGFKQDVITTDGNPNPPFKYLNTDVRAD